MLLSICPNRSLPFSQSPLPCRINDNAPVANVLKPVVATHAGVGVVRDGRPSCWVCRASSRRQVGCMLVGLEGCSDAGDWNDGDVIAAMNRKRRQMRDNFSREGRVRSLHSVSRVWRSAQQDTYWLYLTGTSRVKEAGCGGQAVRRGKVR